VKIKKKYIRIIKRDWVAALPMQCNSTNVLQHLCFRSNLDTYEATTEMNKSLLTFLENRWKAHRQCKWQKMKINRERLRNRERETGRGRGCTLSHWQ